ncbi:MAG: hypothetical protein ACYCZD_12940 [Rhodanobacter sp.]
MKALKGIQDAIALRLRSQSNETLATLRRAEKCVTYLHLHQCTVQQVTVRTNYAVIEIDPPRERWLTGSICIRRVNGLTRETTKVAKVMGCQVQWVEREAHVLLQREG